MLVSDFVTIGNKLHDIRKRMGLTQAEVAEAAKLSDRAYADIERGTVNMRTETMLSICRALCITPNDLLMVEDAVGTADREVLFKRLDMCSPRERETAFALLTVYLDSLNR